ncbi:metallophosphoesterase family protein [Marinilabilia rubra]|uniref:Serine/threonine protein phosphatase n=1 Tax=Marinilabilia rubra TaxID=2162893 RepID=A0A2U2BCY6_9BACT|nr:metallophosphoesterase family protein [Marinilabilia rubra]PWE00928.1 serine/threonine protein phosphatase [Marinilabilia rubra]
MPNTYFIGDVHGCCRTLKKLITEKIRPVKEDLLCFIGDYIDRGPDSKGVIDYVMELQSEGFHVITLRGNHEQMLLDSLNGRRSQKLWLMNGGGETLRSFGVDSVDEIPAPYINFFGQTRMYVNGEKFVAVHAGLDFGVDDPFNDAESMLWIRDFPVDHSFLGGKVLIHGHTPRPLDFVLSQEMSSPVNIDAGCVYQSMGGMGHLVALVFEGGEFLVVQYEG